MSSYSSITPHNPQLSSHQDPEWIMIYKLNLPSLNLNVYSVIIASFVFVDALRYVWPSFFWLNEYTHIISSWCLPYGGSGYIWMTSIVLDHLSSPLLPIWMTSIVLDHLSNPLLPIWMTSIVLDHLSSKLLPSVSVQVMLCNTNTYLRGNNSKNLIAFSSTDLNVK